MKYLNNFFKSLLKGIYSVGEGMCALSIYQPPIRLGNIGRKNNSEYSGLNQDRINLASDCHAVGNDLRKAMDKNKESLDKKVSKIIKL